MGPTTLRHIRLSDDLWEKLGVLCDSEGTTKSEKVRELITRATQKKRNKAAMIVGELTAHDIGKTITIKGGNESITGQLWGITHEAHKISDRKLTDTEDTYTAGESYTMLSIGRWGYARYGQITECELA